MSHLADGLLMRLNCQSKELDNVYYNVACSLGLSENTFWVLYILSDTTQQYSQQEICKEWSFSKQTVNSTVSSLVQKGYVYLERVPDSRNRKVVKLTDKGSLFVQENLLPIRKAEEKALLRMTEQERYFYIMLSQKYVVNLRKETMIYLQSGKGLTPLKG